ncbi:unnamed protein product [Brassica oleracea]
MSRNSVTKGGENKGINPAKAGSSDRTSRREVRYETLNLAESDGWAEVFQIQESLNHEKDIYCLNADGALYDAAVAAFSNLQIPVVALNDNGRIVSISGEEEKNASITMKEAVNKEKRKLTHKNIPFSLTSKLHKKYILADPTAEEESIMDTLVTVVLDSSDQIVAFNKSGGNALAGSSAINQARKRGKELKQILADMDID